MSHWPVQDALYRPEDHTPQMMCLLEPLCRQKALGKQCPEMHTPRSRAMGCMQGGARVVQQRLHLPGGIHEPRELPLLGGAGPALRARVRHCRCRRPLLARAHVQGHRARPRRRAARRQVMHRLLERGALPLKHIPLVRTSSSTLLHWTQSHVRWDSPCLLTRVFSMLHCGAP